MEVDMAVKPMRRFGSDLIVDLLKAQARPISK